MSKAIPTIILYTPQTRKPCFCKNVIKNFIAPPESELHFTTKIAGPLKVYISNGMYTLDFPSRMPVGTANADKVLAALGISTAVEVLKSRDYFVVLPDEGALKNLAPDFELVEKLDATGLIATAKGRSADVVSRCFYPGMGIDEDPVTGSAHCSIVPYWSMQLGKNKLECRQLSSRGGTLLCELQGDRVLMTGKCILFMKGEAFVEVSS